MENLTSYDNSQLNKNFGREDSLKRFFTGMEKGAILTLSIFLLMSNWRVWALLRAKATDNPYIVETKKRTWLEFFHDKELFFLQSASLISIQNIAVLMGCLSMVDLISFL
jgi:hypothetical protein